MPFYAPVVRQLAVIKARALGGGVVAALASKRTKPSSLAFDHRRRFNLR
jgi:hypothetical protein